MNLTDIFLKILSMSLTASYCVLFICIARLFLRRMPKTFSYLLWSVVAVRLLCPVTFESNFSLVGERLLAFTDRIETGSNVSVPIPASFAEPPVTAGEGSLQDQWAEAAGNIDIDTADNTVNAYANRETITGEINTENAADNFIAPNGNVMGNGHLITAHDTSGAEDTSPEEEHTMPAAAFAHPTLQDITKCAAWIWLTVMFGLFGYCALSCVRLNSGLTKKAVYSRHYHGIPVYEVTGLDTPFVAGFAKPAIYLPTGLEEWEAGQCLAHEHTHIRRKDYLVKQSAFLLTCVYWFQPFVWLAYHLMSRDMEMSCDEITLRHANLKDRKTYSNTLVRLSSETRHISGCPLAFSENNTSSRIKNILNLKRPTGRLLVVCSALLSVFAAGLLADPAGSSADAGTLTGTTGTLENFISPGSLGESSSDTGVSAENSMDAGAENDPASSDGQQTIPSADETAENPSGAPMEDPYHTYIPDAFQEFQTACRTSDKDSAAALRREMNSAMTSYWTALVREHSSLLKEADRIADSNTGINGSDEKAEAILRQLYLLETMAAQAKEEMNYMNRTLDAIEGSDYVIKTVDLEANYPLYGTLAENNIIVRSLPKSSAPQVDTLNAGDVVSIISFGRYMLQEDISFENFFLSDAEIQQEYQNYAVVLYQTEEDNDKTARKGYISIDSLEISGNTAETYMYWIGKAWSEALCSRDGAMLYQMAADKKAFTKWDYVSGIHDTEPAQVELNPSNPYPRHFYQIHFLTGNIPEGLKAADTDDLALQFFVQTPEPNVWIQRQNLRIALTSRQLQSIRHIGDLVNNTVCFSEIRNYEQLTSYNEYQDACLAACEYGPCYFDFKSSGYATLYNPNTSAGQLLSFYSSDNLENLTEKYLNLSGGSGEANILTLRTRNNDRITGLIQLAYVEYTFAQTDESGQNKISIPMYYDEDGYWYIWVPGQNEALDEAIYGVLENFPIKAFE